MFDYGHQAPYIWAAYGVSFITLTGLVIYTLRSPKTGPNTGNSQRDNQGDPRE